MNFPELRHRDPSAKVESALVLRNASPVRFAALAALAATIFVAIMQLGAPGHSEGPPAFLSKALGAADSEAPLVRHPEAGVELAIQDSSFRIRSQQRDSHARDAGHGGRRLAPLRARRLPPDRRGRGDDPRRRADTGAVPDDPRAAGPPDLALAHRHGPGSARRRRRRGRVPRHEAPPAHRRFDRAGGHPRRRRQGRHARGSPLERRTAKRQLVADASPRRRGPSPPLCHRPGRHAPKHADEHRGGCHLGHGHEADRRAGQRSPCRPRGGDGQRRGEPRRVGLDDDRDRQQRQRAHRGRLLQGRGRQRARLVLLHLDGVRVAGSRRERDRLLRCEGQLRLRRLKRDHDPRTTPRRSRPLP